MNFQIRTGVRVGRAHTSGLPFLSFFLPLPAHPRAQAPLPSIHGDPNMKSFHSSAHVVRTPAEHRLVMDTFLENEGERGCLLRPPGLGKASLFPLASQALSSPGLSWTCYFLLSMQAPPANPT